MRKNAISTRVLAALSVGALVSTVITVGATSAANAATPKAGGTLYLLEHTPRLDHYDPSRIYTGRDLAFMNSFHTRTLVAYNPVLTLQLTLVFQAIKQRLGSSHYVQELHLKMALLLPVSMLSTALHAYSLPM
jgi:hypothetical protein